MNNNTRRSEGWIHLGKARTFLLFAAAILQAADVLTTNHFLSLPGTIESNPVMRATQTAFGEFWWVPKVLFLPGILYVLARYRKLWPAIVIVALYSIGLANNLYVIVMARSLQQ